MCELSFGSFLLRNENKVLSLVPNAARLSIEFAISSLPSSTQNCGKVWDECSHGPGGIQPSFFKGRQKPLGRFWENEKEWEGLTTFPLISVLYTLSLFRQDFHSRPVLQFALLKFGKRIAETQLTKNSFAETQLTKKKVLPRLS